MNPIIQLYLYWLAKGAVEIQRVQGYVHGQTDTGDGYILLYSPYEHLQHKICRVYVNRWSELPNFIDLNPPPKLTQGNPTKDTAQRTGIYREAPITFVVAIKEGKETQMGKEKRFAGAGPDFPYYKLLNEVWQPFNYAIHGNNPQTQQQPQPTPATPAAPPPPIYPYQPTPNTQNTQQIVEQPAPPPHQGYGDPLLVTQKPTPPPQQNTLPGLNLRYGDGSLAPAGNLILAQTFAAFMLMKQRPPQNRDELLQFHYEQTGTGAENV